MLSNWLKSYCKKTGSAKYHKNAGRIGINLKVSRRNVAMIIKAPDSSCRQDVVRIV